MSLAIGRFLTRASVPRRLRRAVPSLDRVAREAFVAACVRQLRPIWPSRPEVWRIRRLQVRLTVSPQDLDEARLADVWASAFARELMAALSVPGAGRIEAVRFEDRAACLAAVISDHLSGGAASRWGYAEFADVLDLAVPEAALTLFEREPSEMTAVLIALDDRGTLERLLKLFDDVACERLCVLIAAAMGADDGRPLSVNDLVAIGKLALARRDPSDNFALSAGRHRAVRLFVDLVRQRPATRPAYTPRQILDALTAFVHLAEAMPPGQHPWIDRLDTDALTMPGGGPLPRPVVELFGAIRNLLMKSQDHSAAHLSALAELAHVIDGLMPPASRASSVGARSVSSDCAGLFLLVGVLQRLHWQDQIRGSSLAAEYGSRAMSYSLAGLALAILGHVSEPLERLDAGLALFAGWFEEPDIGGLRRFLESDDQVGRRDLLLRLAADLEAPDHHAQSWTSTFAYLADRIVRAFGARVRGFRHANPPSLVRQFLGRPGRVRIERERLVVTLASNPLHVALHVSAADEPVDAVGWLGNRRVEIQIEGL